MTEPPARDDNRRHLLHWIGPALLLTLALAAWWLWQSDRISLKATSWHKLSEGLELGRFNPPKGYAVGADMRAKLESPLVTAVRVDPARFDLRLLSASEKGAQRRTVKEWCEQEGLLAAINASMYGQDLIKSTGYMKNFDHLNNPKINARFGAFIVFHPLVAGLPPLQILDKHQPEWRGLLDQYSTAIQNYRLITPFQDRTWEQSDKAHSVAAFGLDRSGRALLIHCAAPFSIHDFAKILKQLPLQLRSAAYLEGGYEASLYLKLGPVEVRERGIHEGLFWDLGGADDFWPVPNVIGVSRKPD